MAIYSSLLAAHQITAAMSQVADGNMSQTRDFDGLAARNLQQFIGKVFTDTKDCHFFHLKITHSANVGLIDVDYPFEGNVHYVDRYSPFLKAYRLGESVIDSTDVIPNVYKGMDACIAPVDGCILVNRTADCAPLCIYDPKTRHIAAIHAGILGAFTQIVPNTISSMIEWCGSRVEDLLVFIAPCVSNQVYNLDKSGLWNNYLKQHIPLDNPSLFDLKDYLKQQLLELGVLAEHMEIAPYCTAADEGFFSNYKAQSKEEKQRMGRQVIVLGAKNS